MSMCMNSVLNIYVGKLSGDGGDEVVLSGSSDRLTVSKQLYT